MDEHLITYILTFGLIQTVICNCLMVHCPLLYNQDINEHHILTIKIFTC